MKQNITLWQNNHMYIEAGEIRQNKKVLLRERKRHNARRVVTTHSVVLSWLTPPAGPNPPAHRLDLTPSRLDLTPPAGWTWPPQLDLTPPGWTWPPRLDLTPPADWTWTLPPAGLTPPPGRLDPTPPLAGPETLPRLDWELTPPRGQTDWWKDRRVSKHYLPVVLRTRAVKNGIL